MILNRVGYLLLESKYYLYIGTTGALL